MEKMSPRKFKLLSQCHMVTSESNLQDDETADAFLNSLSRDRNLDVSFKDSTHWNSEGFVVLNFNTSGLFIFCFDTVSILF